MQIIYQDEYGETIYSSKEDIPSTQIPAAADTVVIDDEDWRVRSRVFHPAHNIVVVIITQNMIKSTQKESTDSGRLNEMNNAILAVNKRQDASEKRGRALNEQIGSIRKHINQRIQQEKKDTQ